MKKIIFVLAMLFSCHSYAVELLNPYKGGSIAVELYSNLENHLKSNGIQVNVVNLDNCRLISSVWKNYKNPLYISWSDSAKECNVEATHINILLKSTHLFCTNKPLSSLKDNIKIGWQPAGRPLEAVYNAFESKYGKTIKVPYVNGGQQVQGVVSGEIDVALLGQGTALTSNLNCFLSVSPFNDLPVLDHSFGELYDSLTGIMYENPNLAPIIIEFINLPQTKLWKERRKFQDVNNSNERDLFLKNAFRPK